MPRIGKQRVQGENGQSGAGIIHRYYRPFLNHFRRARLERFYRLMNVEGGTRVLDLGGSLFFWELAGRIGLPQPDVTILNVRPAPANVPRYARWIVGDGTDTRLRDNAFDIVFCNSVIEHLGNANAQERMANEIRRLAPRYFVQTPHRLCPVEPHYLSLCVHWLPREVQRRSLRNFTIWGWITRPTQAACDQLVAELRVLGKSEMQSLFPDGEIIVERVAGIPKAIIAFR